MHHGGVAAALGGCVVTRGARIKLGVERHVLILVIHKLPELHHQVRGELIGRKRRTVRDDEEPLQFSRFPHRHGIAGIANHPVAVRILQIAHKTLVEGFGLVGGASG